LESHVRHRHRRRIGFLIPTHQIRRLASLRQNLTEYVLDDIGLGSPADRAKDILGRVYEYFLSQFAIAEGRRADNSIHLRGWSACSWRCWPLIRDVSTITAADRAACSSAVRSPSKRTAVTPDKQEKATETRASDMSPPLTPFRYRIDIGERASLQEQSPSLRSIPRGASALQFEDSRRATRPCSRNPCA
jgi:hypothetical protein